MLCEWEHFLYTADALKSSLYGVYSKHSPTPTYGFEKHYYSKPSHRDIHGRLVLYLSFLFACVRGIDGAEPGAALHCIALHCLGSTGYFVKHSRVIRTSYLMISYLLQMVHFCPHVKKKYSVAKKCVPCNMFLGRPTDLIGSGEKNPEHFFVQDF